MTRLKEGTGVRLRGAETHHQRTATRRADLIVPRESHLTGDAKYRLLSQARRRAQETARRALLP